MTDHDFTRRPLASATPELGLVQVFTSNNGGHPPEFWAMRATRKIIGDADHMPGPIRDQANAFRAQIEATVPFYIREAIKSDRDTQAARLLKG